MLFFGLPKSSMPYNSNQNFILYCNEIMLYLEIMKKELIQELEKNIQQKIIETKKDIKSFEELTRPISPDNAIGRLTRMEAINSKSINEAALRKARQRLSQLEHTLYRLHHPDYGLCIECEEPIPLGRLKIMPETSFCVNCAEKLSN